LNLPAVRAFALRFLVVFAVLLASWPVVGASWSTFFREGAGWLFDPVRGTGVALFEAVPTTDDDWRDTRVLVANREHAQRRQVPAAVFTVSSRHGGFLDLCFLTALVLATPNPWRRRLATLALSLALSVAFVFLRLWIAILYQLPRYPEMELAPVGEPFDSVITVVFESYVADNLEAGLIFSLVVWGAVAVPREAWAALLEGDDQSS
jgi:hypothetical protein